MTDQKFIGWSLLLFHGKTHSLPDDLSEDMCIFVDKEANVLPDIVIDIFSMRCKECPIFDRIYIMFGPVNKKRFVYILENIVKKVLKPDGEFICPSGTIMKTVTNSRNRDFTPEERNLIVEMMRKHGFVFSAGDRNGRRPRMYKFKRN